MPTINQLPVLNTISSGDQLPIYSPNNGDARRTSISSLLTYFQQTFASPTLSTNLYVPTTGFNITVPTPVSNDQWMLLQPAGTLATGTITLPLNTGVPDGTTVLITTTQEITSLTIALNGATAVFGGATSLAAGTGTVIRFYQSTNSWYLITGTTLSATTIDATGDITVKGNASAVKVRNSSNLGGGQISVVNAWNANADITSMAIGAITNLKFFTNNSVTESMTLDTSGNLLVGTTNTSVGQSGLYFEPAWTSAGAAGLGVAHTTGTGSGAIYAYFAYNAVGIGSISQNGTTAVAYNTTSDYRLKTDVAPIQNALQTITALNPVSFTWIDGRPDDGFLAHELQAVLPNCVTGEKDAVNEDGTPKYQQMDNSGVVPFLVKAIQEQQALITNLTARLELLEAK